VAFLKDAGFYLLALLIIAVILADSKVGLTRAVVSSLLTHRALALLKPAVSSRCTRTRR
jgi:hypothetical protein